jgi:hypothetical protein
MNGPGMGSRTPTFLVCPEIAVPPTVSERKRLPKAVVFRVGAVKVRGKIACLRVHPSKLLTTKDLARILNRRVIS